MPEKVQKHGVFWAWRPNLCTKRGSKRFHGRVDASLALTSGLHDADGLAKALLAGAHVGMIASTIYEDGSEQVGRILAGLATGWRRRSTIWSSSSRAA